MRNTRSCLPIDLGILFVPVVSIILLISCTTSPVPEPLLSREEAIPATAIKMAPELDMYPPITHSQLWEQPVPMEGPVNTAGAEDAPVITPDGNTFIFFFTPDVEVPPERQVLDGVTGIWWCTREGETWTEPQRTILSESLAMDGPFSIQGDQLWFGSVRSGNFREIDIYTAELTEDGWANWQNAGEQINVDYWVGELYTTADGNIMYFHSDKDGGIGGIDLWRIEKINNQWNEPVNLGSVINSELDEGWPFVSSDGNELWFTRWSVSGYAGPALFRSLLQDGVWSEPEEIISNFAGDPALDAKGNIYFTHHFFNEESEMIEADIYVAYKK